MRNRRRGRLLAYAAAVASASLVLTGCGGGSSDEGSKDGPLIGVAFQSTAQQRWEFEAKILEKVAAENGDRVIVNYANNNVTTQANQVQSMFQRGIKVLVLGAVDGKAAAPLVSQAHSLGIKVISYDNLVDGKPDFYVTRDGVEAGKLQAEAILKAVPCGEIALIRGDPAIINEREASQGWDEVLAKKPSCVNVVYDNQTPNWDTAVAQKSAEAALQKNPNIKGFLVMWDGGAQGVIPAVKAAGKQPGEVYVTGVDASGPSLSYIAQGWQGSSVWTPIDKMATDAANIAHAFATNGTVPTPDKTVDEVPRRFVDLINIDKSNLCDFVNDIAPENWTTVEKVYGAGKTSCG